MKNSKKLERIMKGAASAHRINILSLLARQKDLDVDIISQRLSLGYKTTAEHLRKLHFAGLITKEHDGSYVLHSLTPLGKKVVAFLQRM